MLQTISATKATTQGSQLAELQRIVQTPRKQISSHRVTADFRMVNEDDFNAKMKQAGIPFFTWSDERKEVVEDLPWVIAHCFLVEFIWKTVHQP
jgi:hypothetical protein